jgi:N-acylglucosamine-6-phosphate 2-epimerase
MNVKSLEQIDSLLSGKLVVSCQPLDDGPMDRDEIVVALAKAALAGGAAGVRIEGVRRVTAVRAATAAPIIGIVKRDLADSPVRITPFLQDVVDLCEAGADIIAVDATDRARPAAINELLAAIHHHGRLAMADCSSCGDALAAHALGFDIVGTTLSGYVGGVVPDEPDLDLVRTFSAAKLPRIMAEGRFNRPADVAAAIRAGAWAVTVGTAITRTEVVTSWFAESMAASATDKRS